MGRTELDTAIGVPFYERESQACLDKTLRNIDVCLNHLQIDPPIVVIVNGPETARDGKHPFVVERSRYNAKVQVIPGEKSGQVNAINDIVSRVGQLGVQRVFITDADIYRFPDSMRSMWDHADRALVGAH